jgi:periplasmic divalent cation tolerance protein
MTEFVVVLTTVPAGFDAVSLAHSLVERDLAACINVLPAMTSVYRWEGKVETAGEHQLVMKTTADKVEALSAALVGAHPYDLPEFIVLPIASGSPAYLNWLRA